MANPPSTRHEPWAIAFACALATFAGSLIVLAAVVAQANGEEGRTAFAESPGSSSATAATVSGTATPSTSPNVVPIPATLTYAGTLPAALQASGISPAPPGKQADISFEDTPGTDHVTTQLLVPVAALGSGVDGLTRAQLDSLLAGRATDWSTVGGVPGKVTYVSAGPPTDQALVAAFTANSTPARTFATYDDLRAAMTLNSGMFALIPIGEVRVSMSAIAIDGIDPVRGRGDATSWPFIATTSLQALTKAGTAALPAIRIALTATAPKVTHVVATGDILQSRCSLAQIKATGDWAAALRGPVGDYLASADLALGSLDGSIQDINPSYECVEQDYPNLSSPPETMAALALAGIDELTVATNHVFDCGTDACGNRAFLETLDFLSKAGIKTVGGGNNLDEALAPAIFDVGGVKFGVLGFDDIAAEDLEATTTEAGTAPMDDSYADEKAALPAEPAFYKPADMLHVSRLQATIAALKQQVDVVIVQIQSGFEDTHEASPRSIKALRAAADAGADLVVGNQGHNVQSIEVRGNAFIAYALGNFIFDQRHTQDETEGYLLEASFWGKQLINVRMVPYQIENQYKPTFVDGVQRAKILGDVFTGSAALPPP